MGGKIHEVGHRKWSQLLEWHHQAPKSMECIKRINQPVITGLRIKWWLKDFWELGKWDEASFFFFLVVSGAGRTLNQGNWHLFSKTQSHSSSFDCLPPPWVSNVLHFKTEETASWAVYSLSWVHTYERSPRWLFGLLLDHLTWEIRDRECREVCRDRVFESDR